MRKLLTALCFTATLARAADFPSETDRLVAASRLWMTIAYFHPYVSRNGIDWDGAFIAAIPKIRSAATPEQYSAAIGGMLEALHDPCTYLLAAPVASPAAISAMPASPAAAIFDLRHKSYSDVGASAIDAPAQRSLTRTAFETATLVKPGRHFEAATADRSGSVFILGENSILPEAAAALAAAGRVTVLSESPHYQVAGTETITLDVAGTNVVIRLSEPEPEVPVHFVNAAEIETEARSMLGKPSLRPPSPRTPAAAMSALDNPYPTLEARILAAAKTWGAIHYFFAYKDLMDEDWDELFAAALPKFITAKDALDYNLTLTDLLTHLTDSHTFARSPTLAAYFGEAPTGVRLRLLDKHPVVVSVLDPAAAQAGIHPGDIVKRVEGESVVDRFNKLVAYVPASTAQRSGLDTVDRILSGPAGSKATLILETPSGETKTAILERSHNYEGAAQRTTEPVRVLTGAVGYMDLDRLSPADVDAALERLRDCKGIIFDLRGKAPASVALATRLAKQPDAPFAIVTTPLALRPDIATTGIATQTAGTFQVLTLPATHAPGFKGKTVALIDERTVGESEHAGLLLEAANKTEFIGSPSAGADTEVSSFTLPGGITVTYSARDIRHANGGKLQRLGLQPSGSAPETAQTIRDGKDVPVEAARAYLSR